MVAEGLLELFECCEVVVDTWALHCLRDFEHCSCFPVLGASVLLYLVSGTVVNEADLFTPDGQDMGVFVERLHFVDLGESHSHRFDAMDSLELSLDEFLVYHVSFRIFYDEKDPRLLSEFLSILLSNRLLVKIYGLFEI